MVVGDGTNITPTDVIVIFRFVSVVTRWRRTDCKGNVIIFNPWMTEITQPNSTSNITKPLGSIPFHSNQTKHPVPIPIYPIILRRGFILWPNITFLSFKTPLGLAVHQFQISVNGIKSSPCQIHSNSIWISPSTAKLAKIKRTSAIPQLRVPTPFEVWTGVD